MSKKNKKVVWTFKAKASLDRYCEFISKDSPSSAKSVKEEILRTTKTLSKNPNLYQLDEYYPNNPGDIRRFFRWSYRIVYQVREDKVVVLEIYHTGNDPNIIGNNE